MRKLILLAGVLVSIMSCSNPSPTAAAEAGSGSDYAEPHRPQFHFSPDSMWMNDPNGLVFFEGEYHMFYQFFPDSNVWGPMHWGHAVSTDLVNWEHLPIALYPDDLGYIFSGSAVIDRDNTSGLGTDGQPPMIAIFTHHDTIGLNSGTNTYQYQSIAFSNDKGRSWTKYEGNPVLPNPGIQDFRDPNVFWHEPTQQWKMILAAKDEIHVYSSSDLLSWDFTCAFGREFGGHGGVWECPDLFELELNGETHWVMLVSINPGGPNGGSATQYFIGDFDGKLFTMSEKFAGKLESDGPQWLDYGTDNYAGVTWSDIPEEDGRRLFIGWMSNWDYGQQVPTERWRSAMTLPRELYLFADGNGVPVVGSRPIPEIDQLRSTSMQLESAVVASRERSLPISFDGQLELNLSIDPAMTSASAFGLYVTNDAGDTLTIAYNQEEAKWSIDRRNSGITGFGNGFAGVHHAPMAMPESLELRLYLDWSSVELFVNVGEIVMTDIFFPESRMNRITLWAENGDLAVKGGEAFLMKRIWE